LSVHGRPQDKRKA
jgi:hypothetical protein